MRRAMFVVSCVALLAACQEPDSRIGSVMVQWMDWPAEVLASQPFTVRMIVSQPCAANGFRDGGSADQSAVTFEPYFLDVNEDVLCARQNSFEIAIGALDTAGLAPGLPADVARTYEMRAATWEPVVQANGLGSLPVRTFGEVTVRPSGVDAVRRNAAGLASVETDDLGCVRIRPFWVGEPEDLVPLDNQASPVFSAFVRGYYYDAAAPVCGETRVFRLVSVN